MATIKEVLKYPFSSWSRLFTVYIAIIPIIGWFFVYGYFMKILEAVSKGQNKMLPSLDDFWGTFRAGFMFFVFGLVLGIVMTIIRIVPVIGLIGYLYLTFLSPILVIQYITTRSFSKGLDFVEATKIMSNNIRKFLILWVKLIAVMLIWAVASLPIITIIITIPAMMYAGYYLYGDFYREVMSGKSVASPKKVVKKKAVKKKAKKK
jgi:hypothetical protein